jgi:hypothetical protein
MVEVPIIAFVVGLSFAFSIRWLPQFYQHRLVHGFSTGFKTTERRLTLLILFNFKRGEATDWTIGV